MPECKMRCFGQEHMHAILRNGYLFGAGMEITSQPPEQIVMEPERQPGEGTDLGIERQPSEYTDQEAERHVSQQTDHKPDLLSADQGHQEADVLSAEQCDEEAETLSNKQIDVGSERQGESVCRTEGSPGPGDVADAMQMVSTLLEHTHDAGAAAVTLARSPSGLSQTCSAAGFTTEEISAQAQEQGAVELSQADERCAGAQLAADPGSMMLSLPMHQVAMGPAHATEAQPACPQSESSQPDPAGADLPSPAELSGLGTAPVTEASQSSPAEGENPSTLLADTAAASQLALILEDEMPRQGVTAAMQAQSAPAVAPACPLTAPTFVNFR